MNFLKAYKSRLVVFSMHLLTWLAWFLNFKVDLPMRKKKYINFCLLPWKHLRILIIVLKPHRNVCSAFPSFLSVILLFHVLYSWKTIRLQYCVSIHCHFFKILSYFYKYIKNDGDFIQSAYGTLFRITAGFRNIFFIWVIGGHLKPGLSYLKRVLERILIITIERKTYFFVFSMKRKRWFETKYSSHDTILLNFHLQSTWK